MGTFSTISERVKKVQKKTDDQEIDGPERRPSGEFHKTLKRRWRFAMQKVVYSAFMMFVMWRCARMNRWVDSLFDVAILESVCVYDEHLVPKVIWHFRGHVQTQASANQSLFA